MTTQSVSPTGQPDWGSITEEICCPLCGYNLQGLVEPRCPECGYAFDWLDLIDPTRRLHLYLFEHHPERNVWSFIKTLTGALLPRRFWRSLHPAQPSNRRRLLVYWLATAIICLAFGLGGLGGAWYLDLRFRIVTPAERTAAAGQFQGPPYAYISWQARVIQEFGTVEAWLDYWHPLRVTPGAFWRHARMNWQPALLCLVVPVWPALTFATLMVFQISMRRVRVRPIHVLRCVVYSFGTLAWVYVLFATLFNGAMLLRIYASNGGSMAGWAMRVGVGTWIAGVVLMVGLLLAVLYQIIIAYYNYLRFDHPIATVLTSQGLVWLALFTVWMTIRFW